MPSSWATPFPLDADQRRPEAFRRILENQSPLLSVAMLALPGLNVPTGLDAGMPTGVQVVAERFREDLCFDVGEAIEARIAPITPVDPRR